MNNIELLEKLKKELTPMGISIKEDVLSTNIFFKKDSFIKIYNNCFSIKSSFETEVFTISKKSIENGYFSMGKSKSDIVLIKFKTEISIFTFKMKVNPSNKNFNETDILMLLSDLAYFILLEMDYRSLLLTKKEQGIINE